MRTHTRIPVRKRVRAALAASTAAALAVVLLAGAPSAALAAPGADLAAEVNPFVGTESEGNAYPGASVPFGMVQLSPDNSNSYGSTSYSNFAGRVWGFSHRHINSAGCPAAGELLVSPSVSADPTTVRTFTSIKAGTESAQAGYYGVTLENDVKVDLTATTRVGVHRYTFPSGTTSNLSFNVGETLRDAGASSIEWTDANTVEGWLDNGGFCGGTPNKSRYYFSATFDREPLSVGTWGDDGAFVPATAKSSVAGGNNGLAVRFDTTADHDVEVSVGVSFVSVDGARANREAEAETDTGAQVAFDTVRDEARTAWNDALGRFDITASDEQRTIFYTQLYKSLLSPTIGSDVDGQYVGLDGKPHTADGWDYYQTFSLWDTYRTQATLHGLFYPERATDIVRSMYQARVEGGWFPRWSLGSLETNIMAGDPVSPWIAENFTLGTVPEDISDQMWDYLVENATTAPPTGVASVGRQSADFYLENGHIPFYPENLGGLGGQFEEYRHGGSATMEFAAADAAIGAAAQRLGKDEVATEFLERGTNWTNLWNPDVQLSGGFTGIVNAVTPQGEFVSVPENTDVTTSGFHEGTPWHYQWMVTQDVVGLQEVMGGRDGFVERLDYYVNISELRSNPGVSPSSWARGGSDYYSSIGYNPGNEPMFMSAWLYGFVGEPTKTSDVLAANLNRFPNTPEGGVGNDDLGTLGSWYVMASLGMQPVTTGSGIMALNAPRIQEASITMAGSETLTISAPGAQEKLPSYIQSVQVDGAEHTAAWLDVSELQDGGTIEFTLGTDPAATSWATAEKDWVPSVSAPRATEPTIVVNDDLAAKFKKMTTLNLGTVIFEQSAEDAPADALEPITATVSWNGGKPVPVATTASEGGWILRTHATFPVAGTAEGVITVVSAAPTAPSAPAVFEPISAEVTVDVTKAGPRGGSHPGKSGATPPGWQRACEVSPVRSCTR